jgi:hypothetical protein
MVSYEETSTYRYARKNRWGNTPAATVEIAARGGNLPHKKEGGIVDFVHLGGYSLQ